MLAFDEACALVGAVLQTPARHEMANDLTKSSSCLDALSRLHRVLDTHVFNASGSRIDLEAVVRICDREARREGFHVLHDWDGKADRITRHTVPIDVLLYIASRRGAEPADRAVVAILLDYYFLYVLALLSLRTWDGDADVDTKLDRLGDLLEALQGANGSGQRFVANPETLLLVATSHFELDGSGYRTLLDRVRELNRTHQLAIALGHAGSLGCHLRFGFEATYGRDIAAMRADNGTDYPWLGFALSVLMERYAVLMERYVELRREDHRGLERDAVERDAVGRDAVEREAVVEGVLNGLSPDPGAFVGPHTVDRELQKLGELLDAHRQHLADDFDAHRPSDGRFSPLSLRFNFSQNVLKGMVVDALLWAEPGALTLNDLLTGMPHPDLSDASCAEVAAAARTPGAGAKQTMARTLMAYARSSPDRIRGRLMPAIVYDPQAGRQSFAATIRTLRS